MWERNVDGTYSLSLAKIYKQGSKWLLVYGVMQQQRYECRTLKDAKNLFHFNVVSSKKDA